MRFRERPHSCRLAVLHLGGTDVADALLGGADVADGGRAIRVSLAAVVTPAVAAVGVRCADLATRLRAVEHGAATQHDGHDGEHAHDRECTHGFLQSGFLGKGDARSSRARRYHQRGTGEKQANRASSPLKNTFRRKKLAQSRKAAKENT